MRTIINPSIQKNLLCPKCGAADAEPEIVRNAYHCRQCDYEMAHIDFATNGSVRGIFGWLKSVGDLIGERYKIQTVLGKGGFGATYLVEDQRVKGKRWALKEIPEMLFDEFEVALLSNLDHPAIPIIADRFTENGMVYLVLKFGGSRTLASETRHKGRIAFAELKSLVLQIGNVLEYLHSRTPPIIHRDLKPENLLLDEAGRIMVIDFGIAKESTPAAMTRTLGRAATYGFSPPEQIMGTGTDSRSDIFSLAATVYFALTGKTPVPAHERVAGKPLPDLASIAADIPGEVNDMVMRGLNLNQNERPQTVREFLKVFGAAPSMAADIPLSGKTVQIADRVSDTVLNTRLKRPQSLSGAPLTSTKASQRHAWIILSAAVLTIIAIAAGAIFWALTQNDTPDSVNKPQTAALPPPAATLPVEQPPAPAGITEAIPATATPAPVAPQPAPQPADTAPAAQEAPEQQQKSPPTEPPQSDKPAKSEKKTLRRAKQPKRPSATDYAAKQSTAKPANKLKTEAQSTPEPAPAAKKESSNWVIIPGQTQKKY